MIDTLSNIPASLKARKQWICWKYKTKPDGKITKPPVNPHTGQIDSATDPALWVSFNEAVDASKRFNLSGIGFALSPDDDLTGGDLDHCWSDNDKLSDTARQVLNLAETYAEISPSGKGIRLIWEGKIPAAVKCDELGIEMYGTGRYLTITGQWIENTPAEIRPAPQTEALLRAAVEGKEKTANNKNRDEDGAKSNGASNFWGNVNGAALANREAWVFDLFPNAKYYASKDTYRVSSKDLGRDLEEDLSIARNGIVDWGVNDLGDPKKGRRSPIELVIQCRNKLFSDWIGAARYLCERLGVTMESLSWQDSPSIDPSNDADIEPADLWAQFDPPSLPRGLLPKIIEDFARVQARLMGSDPAGIAMAALAACGAAIPDRIKLQPKKYDDSWTEAARLWVALVGGVSCKKTPIIRAAVKPINRIDAELFRAYSKAMHEYNQLAAEDKKKVRPPKHKRLRIEDTTYEAAFEIVADSPDGVLCVQDELSGWFGAMEKYGGKGVAKDRSFWLQSYNGGSYASARVIRGNGLVDNLSVSLLGGIQPQPMRKVADEGADDGLIQRILPIILGPATVGKDEPVPNIAGDYADLINQLHRMNEPTLGSITRTATALRFDDDAQKIRNELEEKHVQLAACESINRKLAAHIGKYDGVFVRLCVVWHCIEHSDLDTPSGRDW